MTDDVSKMEVFKVLPEAILIAAGSNPEWV